MNKEKWIWMPHAGHLIVGHLCRFKLNTCVGDYIVSTVGEYVPDSQIREMFAESRGIKLEGKGDAREADFIKKNGYEELGLDRTYETMVFKCRKSQRKSPDWDCCPYEAIIEDEAEARGYNKATDAYKGHLELCEKYSKL